MWVPPANLTTRNIISQTVNWKSRQGQLKKSCLKSDTQHEKWTKSHSVPSSFKRFRELFRFRMPDDSHWPLFILFPCLCSFHYSSSGHRESDTSEAWKPMIDRIFGHLESHAAAFPSQLNTFKSAGPPVFAFVHKPWFATSLCAAARPWP